MTPALARHFELLGEKLQQGASIFDALPDSIGGLALCDGLWRIYSRSWPEGGITTWNKSSPWAMSWKQLLQPGLYSFGEDVFGNQIVVLHDSAQSYLWNHEDGSCHALLVPPDELFETVFRSGLDWIDFYHDGSLEVARRMGRISDGEHLHWITPGILGGSVSLGNVTVVKRDSHLVGHAMLWAQVAGLPPGTTVIAR